MITTSRITIPLTSGKQKMESTQTKNTVYSRI